MNLKALARQYVTSEGVTFYLLPYRTVLADVAYFEMEKVLPAEQWTQLHQMFVIAEPLTVDIEFPDNLPSEWLGLQMYWQERNGSTAHNWELFKQVVSSSINNQWFAAYDATRDHALDAPEELQEAAVESDDPNLKAAARKRKPR